MSLYEDSRAKWGATKNTWDHYVKPTQRTRRVWHWPGGPTGIKESDSHDKCLRLVKAWETYHRSKGFGGIGYNFLICPHARVIEGRGLNYVGAHCPGWNTIGWGIQFMRGQGEKVTDKMYSRGTALAQDLEKAANGMDFWDNGHREGFATTCPGDQTQQWVDSGGPEKGTGTKPKPPPETGVLVVDGNWGRATTRAAQKVFKSGYVDGIVSRQRKDVLAANPGLIPNSWEGLSGTVSGSPLIVEIQKWLGVDDDGVWGEDTARAFQKKLGTYVDGEIWERSPAVKKFQKYLNKKLAG